MNSTNTSEKQRDIQQTKKIQILLRDKYGLEESQQSLRHRQQVIGTLNTILQEWVVKVGQQKKISKQQSLQRGFAILTFGSYRLRVQSPDADIDTLIVAPRHIDRDYFFRTLYQMLQANSKTSEITSVQTARVPVIKLVFSQVHIDLLFARIASQTIDPNLDDLSDDEILRKCDAATALSLNGRRVTDKMLQEIPQNCRDSFRMTLKCIKLWAKKRGIYSNILGYPGGVALAILVAKICKLYNKSANNTPQNGIKPNILLKLFFQSYSEWKWPAPVMLNDEFVKHDWAVSGVEQWGQKDVSNDLMPIITPSFPEQNATYNVSKSTLNVILQQLRHALQVVTQIQQSKKDWNDLFDEFNFFRQFRYFLRIDILSDSNTSKQQWQGFIESKLRILIINLQNVKGLVIRPWPKSYSIKYDIDKEGHAFNECQTFFFGLTFNAQDSRLQKVEKAQDGKYVLNLDQAVQNFITKCMYLDGQLVDPRHMNIKIGLVMRYQLPNQVFKNGQRPKWATRRPDRNVDQLRVDNVQEPQILKKKKI